MSKTAPEVLLMPRWIVIMPKSIGKLQASCTYACYEVFTECATEAEAVLRVAELNAEIPKPA
jgi:hypothetical protein